MTLIGRAYNVTWSILDPNIQVGPQAGEKGKRNSIHTEYRRDYRRDVRIESKGKQWNKCDEQVVTIRSKKASNPEETSS